jgi:type II secretory pathway pseudopilin PulG
MTHAARAGVKLVELLIVVAIVGVVTMIALPIAMIMREEHLRQQTNNNLHACAIAIHNYESTYKKLPHAAWTNGDYKDDAKRSMWFHLLPYVQAKTAYDDNVHDAVVPAYLAPSDPSLGEAKGRTCFAGNIRVFGYRTLKPTNANGAVAEKTGAPSGLAVSELLSDEMISGLTLARIPDGTSNTFMIATRYAECGSPAVTTHYSASPIGTILAAGGPVPSKGVPAGQFAGAFFGAGSHHMPADASSRDAMFQISPGRGECIADAGLFGHSFQPFRISIALADATVRSMESTTSPTTFCRGLCPGDGYPVFTDEWD